VDVRRGDLADQRGPRQVADLPQVVGHVADGGDAAQQVPPQHRLGQRPVRRRRQVLVRVDQPRDDVPPGETVTAIVAEAKRQGIAVWAHAAVFPATPGEVIGAGVDSVSHVHLMVHEAAGRALTTYQDKPPVDHARFAGGDDAVMEGLFARMREQGTVLDATASLWHRIGRELAADAEADPEAVERAAANDALSAVLTRQAWLAGVTVSAGTDRDPDAAEPWPPLFDELDYFVGRCGMTPAEALRCASFGGAVSLGAADRLGTLEPGKQADFVVLAEDPAADLAALRTVVSVVKRGRRFEGGHA
jgi:imidazolonepropionase-like amidohydrolase